jgi:CRISPR-associated protein Cmr4
MQARLFHLHALSALHCGTGQSAGVVDLPIARARATALPIVPGSSLRGVLREDLSRTDKDLARTLFGPRMVSGDADSFAGALAIGDAHLLLLPVRCLAGIVCFATAPFVLKRYAADRARAQLGHPPLPDAPAAGQAWVPTEQSVNLLDGRLVLEDLDLHGQANAATEQWAQAIAADIHAQDGTAADELAKRIAVLPDDVFGFLAETATDIRARIAIDDNSGTVRNGALWYEENLPAESVLWGVYALERSHNPDDERTADALAAALPAAEALLQLGGKAGVGRGLARLLTEHREATR